MVVAASRNHLYLLGQQVKIRYSPRNQQKPRPRGVFCVQPPETALQPRTCACGIGPMMLT